LRHSILPQRKLLLRVVKGNRNAIFRKKPIDL
jgi:hypothetical protein